MKILVANLGSTSLSIVYSTWTQSNSLLVVVSNASVQNKANVLWKLEETSGTGSSCTGS